MDEIPGQDQVVTPTTFSLIPRGEFVNLSDLRIPQLVTSAIQFLIVAAFILFFFTIVLGGLKMILSFGKKEKMDEAKRQLVNALIGIVIVLSSWAIMNFVGYFFGVDFTNIQIPTV